MATNIDSSSTTITEQINLLRSILRSDDHLQIQSSGDYEQVRIKLDHDVQITFFFDSLQILNQSLTLAHVHDIRINKSSNKCPLNNDQWTNVRKHFDELTQKSDKNTPLQSIIELIHTNLSQTKIPNSRYRPKEKKSSVVTTYEDTTTAQSKFRGADLIFNRILHDRTIDRSQVIIGYEDRFTGIHEIAFNEFKKVHEHEYGVPMHRIRHFKINGNIVWDRTNKIDILTGSEQQKENLNDVKEGLSLRQGLYHFDQLFQQWTQEPHTELTDDDPKTPSSNETYLPQQCHFITWNVLFDRHHSRFIHTERRYPAMLRTLKSLLPDLICLQEVTAPFLNLLLNETWVQENNYYIIIMQRVITSEEENSYGQVILMKNFRPRAFSICPLDVADESVSATTTTMATKIKKPKKEIIISRFGLASRVTIDLVNLHLPSDHTPNASGKRCRTLENLLRTMNTNNYMLIGDFNFGDSDMKEQEILRRYENVHDLWTDTYNINENPGYTFAPSTNHCAKITSVAQLDRRLDRYFIHTLQNLSYSIQHLDIAGTEAFTIAKHNNDNDERINLSDHYALQLMVHFRTRSISHRSALVILSTANHEAFIDSYREQYDPSFGRWPPHINLLWPFFDLTDSHDDEFNILLPLRLLLCQFQSFDLEINEIDKFVENNICYMKPNEQSIRYVKELYQQLKQLYPQCCTNNRNAYNPHMTIAQFDNEDKRKQAQSALILEKPFAFPVDYVYVLQRPHDNDTTPFQITYHLPLGHLLHPLGINQKHSSHPQLQHLFQTLNLYETQQSYEQKQDKFHKLSSCFDEMFNQQTLHCFTHSFLPYGSFRIGINGGDVDTVFVLNEMKSNNNNERTTFDEQLYQLKDNKDALNDHIVDLLMTQIDGSLKDEMVYCRKIQALFPIISILFKDQTKVETFIQIRMNQENSAAEEEIHGVHEMEQLLIHARSPPIFQHLLAYVRAWAQHVGLYGQVYGYLGGYSWAILCAHICHTYLSSIKSLSSIEQFSIDEFFALVHNFFSTCAQFPWSSQAFSLHQTASSSLSKQIKQSQKSSILQRGSMRILSPYPPHNNTARSTSNSSRDLIQQGFQRVVQLLHNINTITSEDKSNALQQILQLDNDFPNSNIKCLLQLTLSAETTPDLDDWIGWMRSRLAYFVNDCEEKCHLTVQTQNNVEYRSKNDAEVYYSIGFEVDEETLNNHQHFTACLNKFLNQFNLYSNRKETMKRSHKLVSIHDWKLERMQPKAPRTT